MSYSIKDSRKILLSVAITFPLIFFTAREIENYLPKTRENIIEHVRGKASEAEKKDKLEIRDPLIYGDIITPEYISSIIQIESSGNARAVSHSGARGLMQIMPETWQDESRKLYGKELDLNLAFDPEINKKVGTFYMETISNYLSNRIDGWQNLSIAEKQNLVAAAYSGGMGRLARNNGDISKMPEETKNYVEKLEKLMRN